MMWNPEAPPTEQRWFGGTVVGITPTVIGDERGRLAELVRRSESAAAIKQVYAVWVAPGASRGEHYHMHKDEWFIVINGMCRLDLVEMATGERLSLRVGIGGDCMVVSLPPRVLHTFTNEAKEGDALIIACSSTEYDPANPDRWWARQWETEGHGHG